MRTVWSQLSLALLLSFSSASLLPLGAQGSRTHSVEIIGLKFVPEVVQARVGDRIDFINKDVVPHTATHKPEGWDSGTLTKGKSWSVTIGKPGTFDYFCRFHPNMTGRIIVE